MSHHQITLGFSPCPNDTFIFDGLVNGHIHTGGLKFDVVLADVQTLNQWALEGKLDATKISYGVLHQVLPQYRLLQSGGALGFGVGPLLIGAEPLPGSNQDISTAVNNLQIALPGANTTAHHLFSTAFPNARHKTFLPFHQIEDFVASGQGLGVIIHENRFTYHHRGLHQWLDLGSFWEKATGGPIPLGGIVLKSSFPSSVANQLNTLVQNSIAYAWAAYPKLSPYVQAHAQEMSETVMRQHINLYVNQYSHSLSTVGLNAVRTLLGSQTDAPIDDSKVFW
ncbi:MAG: 1,4-dihydroxy-6-naphthoate synthase [Bacteroidetes bacterium]|nr:MAG: 1,4-dihydroxy-6-naphthoate synthase [Bacteroidota bacterium]